VKPRVEVDFERAIAEGREVLRLLDRAAEVAERREEEKRGWTSNRDPGDEQPEVGR
jgi:hypothetical protein